MNLVLFMQLLLTILFVFSSLVGADNVDNAEEQQKNDDQFVVFNSSHEKTKRHMLLDLISKGVVMVKVKAYVNATEANSESWKGTGFIIDKERGLIATNHHVAGSFSVCSYELKFSNGLKVPARRRYIDPFLDFAILEVNTKNIPDDCTALKLSDQNLRTNDEITAMGNAAGDEFSTQEGTIFNTFVTTNVLKKHL